MGTPKVHLAGVQNHRGRKITYPPPPSWFSLGGWEEVLVRPLKCNNWLLFPSSCFPLANSRPGWEQFSRSVLQRSGQNWKLWIQPRGGEADGSRRRGWRLDIPKRPRDQGKEAGWQHRRGQAGQAKHVLFPRLRDVWKRH